MRSIKSCSPSFSLRASFPPAARPRVHPLRLRPPHPARRPPHRPCAVSQRPAAYQIQQACACRGSLCACRCSSDGGLIIHFFMVAVQPTIKGAALFRYGDILCFLIYIYFRLNFPLSQPSPRAVKSIDGAAAIPSAS